MSPHPPKLASTISKAFALGCLLSLAACSDAGNDWPDVAAIPLVNPDGVFWGPMLTVGDQTFLVHLDTGSSTTAIAGAACASCASVGVSPLYTPSASATDEQRTAQARYADMSGWSGEIYTDRISLGEGTPTLPMAITNITDNVMKFFFDANGYQGILGLGAPENAVPHTGAYVDVATQGGAVPIMAFELCSADGTMWFGGFDETKAASAPVYTPLLPISAENPFYTVDINSMSLGSTQVASAADLRASAGSPIVDTGTTFFIAPQAVVARARATVNGSAGFKALFGSTAQLGTIDSANQGCVTRPGVTEAMVDAMLPPLTFRFPSTVAGAPDVSVTVPPTSSYILDLGTGEWCFGVLPSADGTTILGDFILRSFVTIIDLESQQVGWALDRGCSLASRRRSIHRDHLRPRPQRPRPSHH